MSRNNQSNRIIKWLVMVWDFIVLNAVMLAFAEWVGMTIPKMMEKMDEVYKELERI